MPKFKRRLDLTPEKLNHRAIRSLIHIMGIDIRHVEDGLLRANMKIRPHRMAPNGFLHGGAVVTLADSACGCATYAHLPGKATSFTTIELKCNYLGTAEARTLICTASCHHLGRSTQIWDASMMNSSNEKIIALFRCTQIIFYSN